MRFSLQSSSNSSRSPRARASKVGHATCTPKTNKDSAHDSVENVLKARRKMSTKVNDMENIQGSLTRSNFAQHSFGFCFVWKTNFPGKCTTKGERFKGEWTLVREKGSGWEETGSETKSCDVASLLAYRKDSMEILRLSLVPGEKIHCGIKFQVEIFSFTSSDGPFSSLWHRKAFSTLSLQKLFSFCFGFYWLTFLSLHVMISVVTKRFLLQLEEISLLKSDEHNKIVNA